MRKFIRKIGNKVVVSFGAFLIFSLLNLMKYSLFLLYSCLVYFLWIIISYLYTGTLTTHNWFVPVLQVVIGGVSSALFSKWYRSNSEFIDSEVFVAFYISAMVCVLWTDIIVFS